MISSFAMIDKKDVDILKLRNYLDNRKQTQLQRESPQETRETVIKMLSEGITQYEIARGLGIQQTTVSHIKRKYYDIQPKKEDKDVINNEGNVINNDKPLNDKKNNSESSDYDQLTQNQPSENTLKTKEEDETSEKR